ncbi:MAG: hypothetical protein K4445_13240 [Deltaproteobacteria bacterium]|nr:hypothetical protein [Syntrophaceae bacterium]
MACNAFGAPNAPVHQTIVVGLENARANPAKNEERKTRPGARRFVIDFLERLL